MAVHHADCQQAKAKAFLKTYNKEGPEFLSVYVQAYWDQETNITEHNSNKSIEAVLVYADYIQEIKRNASRISLDKVSWNLRRQLKLLTMSAISKDKAKRERLSRVSNKMMEIYASGCVNATNKDVKLIKIPDGETRCLSLNPDLHSIMRTSRDEKELVFAWKGWRDAVGPTIRPLFKEMVTLGNQAAKENSWMDLGEWLRSPYGKKNLPKLAARLWREVKPLYEELHAYVRFKLSLTYPDVVKDRKPIPGHLLGNMWSQTWENVYDLVVPFPGEASLDVTPKLKSRMKNATAMFKEAERFFVSIGWPALPASFWEKSMLTKPVGRKVVCHASAWSFIKQDVRIKMCAEVNQKDFTTIHHELGHIYYFLLYGNQPMAYRDGANPGFHEAVGDVMSLSVQTPRHLHRIGLLDSVTKNTKSELNFLLQMALKKIAFLPFGYMIDQWRWNVFNEKTGAHEYNRKWWDLRKKYQGISPATTRSENDFDPGAKYHIASNVPYIRYFFSYIMQFDFHDAACKASGFTGPLHDCSIYQSRAAGKKLKDMLKLGKSKPWPVAYRKLTGKSRMDAKAVSRYFQPLIKWMRQQRKKHGYSLGWH